MRITIENLENTPVIVRYYDGDGSCNDKVVILDNDESVEVITTNMQDLCLNITKVSVKK